MASTLPMGLLLLPPSLLLTITSSGLIHRFTIKLPFTCQNWIPSLLSRVSGLKSYLLLFNPTYSVVKELSSNVWRWSLSALCTPLLAILFLYKTISLLVSQRISTETLSLFLVDLFLHYLPSFHETFDSISTNQHIK